MARLTKEPGQVLGARKRWVSPTLVKRLNGGRQILLGSAGPCRHAPDRAEDEDGRTARLHPNQSHRLGNRLLWAGTRARVPTGQVLGRCGTQRRRRVGSAKWDVGSAEFLSEANHHGRSFHSGDYQAPTTAGSRHRPQTCQLIIPHLLPAPWTPTTLPIISPRAVSSDSAA